MDEEENSQGQEQQQNGGKTPQNVAGKAAESAKEVSRKAGNASQYTSNLAHNFQERATKATNAGKAGKADRLNKSAERLKQASERMAKVQQKAQRFAQIATRISKIIATAGLFILIALIIIGLLVFLITGFGMIWSTLKDIAKNFWQACYDVIYGGETAVSEEDVVEVMDDLESMGYDLYGYGFVAGYTTGTETTTTTDDDGNETTTEEEAKIYYTTDDNGNVHLIDELVDKGAYRYLKAYLISDNYAYFIKNSNKNFRTAFSSAKTFLTGLFLDRTAWGSGLISIYKQKNSSSGDEITGLTGTPWAEASGWDIFTPGGIVKYLYKSSQGSISINRDNNTLIIEAEGLFSRQSFSYNLDGWVGRYSMPLEFLLSVHLATMSPDLSYSLATEFETDVQILLYEAESDIAGGLDKNGDGIVDITYTEMKEAIDKDSLFWVDLSFGRDDAADVFEAGLLSSQTDGIYACTGTTTPDRVQSFSLTEFSGYADILSYKMNENGGQRGCYGCGRILE